MRRTKPTGRARGFTLIEAIIAIVILATAVPINVIVLRDNLVVRGESIRAHQSYWLAVSITEQILADRAHGHPLLAGDPAETFGDYLDDPADGLLARQAEHIALAAELGISLDITLGPLRSLDDSTTGDASLDIYWTIEIGVSWPRADGTIQSQPLSVVLVDRSGTT